MLETLAINVIPFAPAVFVVGLATYLSERKADTAVVLIVLAALAVLLRPASQLHYDAEPTIWLRVWHGFTIDGVVALLVATVFAILLHLLFWLMPVRDPKDAT